MAISGKTSSRRRVRVGWSGARRVRFMPLASRRGFRAQVLADQGGQFRDETAARHDLLATGLGGFLKGFGIDVGTECDAGDAGGEGAVLLDRLGSDEVTGGEVEEQEGRTGLLQTGQDASLRAQGFNAAPESLGRACHFRGEEEVSAEE